MKGKGGAVVGIDASNIRAGGGLLHLQKILNEFVGVHEKGVSEVRLWVSPCIAESMPNKSWLKVYPVKFFDFLPLRLLYRFFWLRRLLSKCDVVFFPGGILLPVKARRVSMCQNLQPFVAEDRERASGWQRLRVEILRVVLGFSFKRADKTIFVSSYSREIVERSIGGRIPSEVVPHGCGEEFFEVGRQRENVSVNSLNVLYVSTINTYKNQDVAVLAVKMIRDQGVPATITLVGGGYEPCLSDRLSLFKRLDPDGEWIFYKGKLPYNGVLSELGNANCALFLSTCETFGLSLVESMAAGLPIICSNIRPMSDLVGNAAFELVDPLNVEAVSNALGKLYEERNELTKYHGLSVKQALDFTWSSASRKTFETILGKNEL